MLTRATHRSPPIFDCSTSKFEITTPFLVLFNKILQKEAPVCSKVRYLLSKCNAKTKTAARRTGRLRQIGEGLILLWFLPASERTDEFAAFSNIPNELNNLGQLTNDSKQEIFGEMKKVTDNFQIKERMTAFST